MSILDIANELPNPESTLPYFTGELQDYSSLQESIYFVNIFFIVLVLVGLALRIFVRFYTIRAAGVDDALLVVAALSALVLFSASLSGAYNGLGKHVWNLDTIAANIPGETSRIVKIEFAAYIAYATAISFTKFSIITSYIRIFPEKNIRRISYGTGFVVLGFLICSSATICFACYPIEALWDWEIAGATCFPLVNYLYFAAACNIATDVVLCVLPIPTLWSLNMPKAQRIVVSVLFSLGIFACIASFLRMAQLHNLDGSDLTYKTVGTLNWSSAEVGTALFCSCISALRPLASKVFPGFFKRLFSQPSSITPDSNKATNLSNSSRSQTSQYSFAIHEELDNVFELIHQHADAAEGLPPPLPLKDRAYLISKNGIIPIRKC